MIEPTEKDIDFRVVCSWRAPDKEMFGTIKGIDGKNATILWDELKETGTTIQMSYAELDWAPRLRSEK